VLTNLTIIILGVQFLSLYFNLSKYTMRHNQIPHVDYINLYSLLCVTDRKRGNANRLEFIFFSSDLSLPNPISLSVRQSA